jgi:hypothetical protein
VYCKMRRGSRNGNCVALDMTSGSVQYFQYTQKIPQLLPLTACLPGVPVIGSCVVFIRRFEVYASLFVILKHIRST